MLPVRHRLVSMERVSLHLNVLATEALQLEAVRPDLECVVSVSRFFGDCFQFSKEVPF